MCALGCQWVDWKACSVGHRGRPPLAALPCAALLLWHCLTPPPASMQPCPGTLNCAAPPLHADRPVGGRQHKRQREASQQAQQRASQQLQEDAEAAAAPEEEEEPPQRRQQQQAAQGPSGSQECCSHCGISFAEAKGNRRSHPTLAEQWVCPPCAYYATRHNGALPPATLVHWRQLVTAADAQEETERQQAAAAGQQWSRRCSNPACGRTQPGSGGWRRHRVTRKRLCNPCYMHAYLRSNLLPGAFVVQRRGQQPKRSRRREGSGKGGGKGSKR